MSTATKRFSRHNIASLFVGLAFCAPLSASEVAETGSMTIYASVAGASEILSREYAKAIDTMLHSRGGGETKILRSNNLCVAYTLIGQLSSARAACDNAVYEAALSRNYGDWFKRYISFRAKSRYKSRAFANRSVLRMMSGDTTGAAEDLGRANALKR